MSVIAWSIGLPHTRALPLFLIKVFHSRGRQVGLAYSFDRLFLVKPLNDWLQWHILCISYCISNLRSASLELFNEKSPKDTWCSPSAATIKSKKDTRPTLDAGEFGCTPSTRYPHFPAPSVPCEFPIASLGGRTTEISNTPITAATKALLVSQEAHNV